MHGNRTGAWSTLRTVLAGKNLTVTDLHERLVKADCAVNVKSLYRLTTSEPLQKIDLEIVGAICAVLELEIGDLIRFEKPKVEWMCLESASQEELHRLMDRNNEGRLTEEERVKFDALLEQVQRITLHNSQLLVDQKRFQERSRWRRAKARRVETAG